MANDKTFFSKLLKNGNSSGNVEKKLVWHCKYCGSIQDVDVNDNICLNCGSDLMMVGETIWVEDRDRKDQERKEREHKERERRELERKERERKEREIKEQERKEQERKEQERKEQERKEQERKEQERKEQERKEQERKEQERKEQERKKREQKDQKNSDQGDDQKNIEKDRKRWRKPVLAAFILVLIVCCGLLAWKFLPEKTPVIDQNNNDHDDQGDTQTVLRTAKVNNQTDFQSAMNDSEIDDVEITGDFDLTTDMDITKPVKILGGRNVGVHCFVDLMSTLTVCSNANMDNYSNFTVKSGGNLVIDGSSNSFGLYRTVGGGRIEVAADGWASFIGGVWLENEEDLDLNGRRDNYSINQSLYTVLDESSDFLNAATVKNTEEFANASDDKRIPSIVVGSSFSLEWAVEVNKPVLIRENVVLDCNKNNLRINSTCLNKGTINGDVIIGNNGVLINEAYVFMRPDSDGGAGIINLSKMELYFGQFRYSSILNMGMIRHDAYGGEMNWLDLAGVNLINIADFNIAPGNTATFAEGSRCENFGCIYLESGAELVNQGHMGLCGESGYLKVEGRFDNTLGHIEADSARLLMTMNGGTVEGGTMWTWSDGVWAADRGSLIDLQIISKSFDSAPSGRVVSSEDELITALRKGYSPQILGNVEVNGNLKAAKGIIFVGAGSSLTVHGNLTVKILSVEGGTVTADSMTVPDGGYLMVKDTGSLILNGGDLLFQSGNGALFNDYVELNGGRVILKDAILLAKTNLSGCGGIILSDENCLMSIQGNLSLTNEAKIDVQGGRLLTLTYIDCGGGLNVGKNGEFSATGGVQFGNAVGDATIENAGRVSFAHCQIQINDDVPVTNKGEMFLYNWNWQQLQLSSRFDNRGQVNLGGEVFIYGEFINRGEVNLNGFVHAYGSFDNRGKVYSDNRESGFESNWRGEGVIYR